MGCPPVILCPESMWKLNRVRYCLDQEGLYKTLGMHRLAHVWQTNAMKYFNEAEFAERTRMVTV